MNPDARRYIRTILGLTVAAILATSLVTKPGYTSAGPGAASSVERYFGWPAEYYADDWKAPTGTAPSPGMITFLPLPPSGMVLVDSDFEARALLLNLMFLCCWTLLAILLGYVIDRERVELVVWLAAIPLLGLAVALFVSADSVGAML